MTETVAPQGAVSLWRAMLGLPEALKPVLQWEDRNGWIDALSPALVADLVPELALDMEAVNEARLYGKFQQALQLKVLEWIGAAGLSCIAIKGFAAAFLYYPNPPSRLLGDLDLLVRPADVPPLVDCLKRRDFRFGSAEEKPWGFLSDASFMPLHSPDGTTNVDIHFKPDSYPLPLGLDTDQVFAKARQVMAGGHAVAVPCPVHLALLFVSNLAKDKFQPQGLRKLLDLARLLASEHDFSWSELVELAGRARLGKALQTSCALLRGLGTPAALLPPQLGQAQSAAVQRLLRDWCRQSEPSLLQRLEREWLLAAEPHVAARLLVRRGWGLVRPRTGMPEGST